MSVYFFEVEEGTLIGLEPGYPSVRFFELEEGTLIGLNQVI